MKNKSTLLEHVACTVLPIIFFGALIVLLLFQLGCATQKPFGLTRNSPPISKELLANLGTVGIISTSTIPFLSIQKPLSKHEAIIKATEKPTIWDDYIEFPFGNPFSAIMLAPVMVASSVPVKLMNEAIGAAKGVSEKCQQESIEPITKLVAEVNLQQRLSNQILTKAKTSSNHPLVLVKKPFPAGFEKEFSKLNCVMAGTLAWVPKGQTPASYLLSQGIDTALEIQLLYPGLRGDGDINPLMALHAEVRARLIRVRDGKEIYSCSMNYFSPRRKFDEWASNNAQPLRDELENFCQIASNQIVEQLSISTWSSQHPVNLASTFEK